MGCERVDAWGALVPFLAPGPVEEKKKSLSRYATSGVAGFGGGS